MRKYFFYCLVIISYSFFVIPSQVYASYMLPYPSTMPGNKIYKITRILDSLKEYWYFGDIAQAKYHLMLSDKYLVEAKTLFEYRQYLLGQDALIRSDTQFAALSDSLKSIEKNGKNATEIKRLVQDAADSHIALLNILQSNTPMEFEWTPEKGNVTHIPIHDMISDAKNLRMKVKNSSDN